MGTDFKYDNIVFKFQPKNPQAKHFSYPNGAFLVPNLGIFFERILQLDILEGAHFKYNNSFFKIQDQKYPKMAFFIPNLCIFIFLQKFELDKFECAEVKYDNITF